MTTKISTNGQVRKSLADQIDRLDGMLDGLSDGLNEAVADAVKDAVGAAVQQAVQAVLREVLTSPEILARLLPAGAAAPVAPPAPTASATPGLPAEPIAPPPAPSSPAPKACAKPRRKSVRQKLGAAVASVRTECGRRLDQVRRCVAGAWERVSNLGGFVRPMMTVVGLGLTAGAGTVWARPWLTGAFNVAARLAATATAQVSTAWQQLGMPGLAFLG